MAIPETYAANSGNLVKFLDAVRTAGVPERVTFEFLKTLGFKSSNDRPIISVLKGIGFLDQNGAPTASYRAFRDPSEGPRVLAQALRRAYSDIFLANENAQELSVEKIRGIVAAKTSKGERAIREIANTFKALTAKADFTAGPSPGSDEVEAEEVDSVSDPDDEAEADAPRPRRQRDSRRDELRADAHQFHYNIQIHLPTTTDISVYNAIFKSLRENLL